MSSPAPRVTRGGACWSVGHRLSCRGLDGPDPALHTTPSKGVFTECQALSCALGWEGDRWAGLHLEETGSLEGPQTHAQDRGSRQASMGHLPAGMQVSWGRDFKLTSRRLAALRVSRSLLGPEGGRVFPAEGAEAAGTQSGPSSQKPLRVTPAQG